MNTCHDDDGGSCQESNGIDYITHFRHYENGLRNGHSSENLPSNGSPRLCLDMVHPRKDEVALSRHNPESFLPFTSLQPYFQAPPQLPPETYNYLIHALLSLQGSSSHPPTYNHPWPSPIAPPIPTGPLSFYPINPPIPFPVPHSAGSSQLTPSPTASTAQDPEGSEDGLTITEDKRRRNTAASGEGVHYSWRIVVLIA